MLPKPISWLGMEKKTKPNTTKAHIHESKCTATQNKHKKTKARFSGLLRHPAWKWRGPILVSTLHKFVTYLLTYLHTYPFTYSPRPIWGCHIGPSLSSRS